jgi:hypothetical protein
MIQCRYCSKNIKKTSVVYCGLSQIIINKMKLKKFIDLIYYKGGVTCRTYKNFTGLLNYIKKRENKFFKLKF